MSSWVKGEIAFGRRLKRVVLPCRLRMQGKNHVAVLMIGDKPDPDAVEEYLRKIIAHHRPEWSAAVIVAMRFDFGAIRWEMVLEHGAFPIVPDGVNLEAEPLILEVDEMHSQELVKPSADE